MPANGNAESGDAYYWSSQLAYAVTRPDPETCTATVRNKRHVELFRYIHHVLIEREQKLQYLIKSLFVQEFANRKQKPYNCVCDGSRQ